jgi:hypothetical protein
LPSSPCTPQLRPLSIGEVLDAGFRLLRHRLGTLVLCVLLPAIPLTIARTVVIASTNPDYYDVNAIVVDDSDETTRAIGALIAVGLLGLGAVLAVAACFRVISAAYLGEPITALRSLAAGVRRIPALFIASLVLGVVIGFIFGVTVQVYVTAPLLVWLSVKWSVTTPVIVAERAGPFRAMRRSWQLTRNHWWRTLATLLVLGLITLVLWVALVVSVTAALNGLESISEFALATLDTVFIVIVLVLIYPLIAAILTVMYFDMRVRNEGFDLQLLARGVGADISRFEQAPERPVSPVPALTTSGSPGGGFAPPEGPASAS